MSENELVVYGQNGEIVECSFERIDLTRPATILTYCSDLKAEMSKLLEGSAQLVVYTEPEELSEKEIAKIGGFEESLEESEKKQTKNTIIKSVKGLLSKFGLQSFQENIKEDNYVTRLQEYFQILDKMVSSVEIDMQNTLNNIDLSRTLVEALTPLVGELELRIKVGIEDKAKFDKETEELKATLDLSNPDNVAIISYREQSSNYFNNKLNELQKALVEYKAQLHHKKITEISKMELVSANNSYLEDSIPLLKSVGASLVDGKIHERRLKKQLMLDEVTNQAIIKNRQLMESNLQKTSEMVMNGRITMDTIRTVQTSIKNGYQVLQNSRREKQKRNEQEKIELQKLNETLNQYNEEFLNLIDEQNVIKEVIEVAPQKRIGGK